jgi:2-polyprenyl-6-methoxyphenol hydroxylase-like FAD-dependent oxidoreductase
LTEFTVRELLCETPNIALRERTEVTGLKLAPGDLRQVIGVAVRARGGDEGSRSPRHPEEAGAAPAEIEADLIVDASGRGSRAPSWLRAAGAEVPEETVVDCFAGYSSRWYRAPKKERWPEAWWWKGLWIEAAPPSQLLGGVLFPIEDGRWVVTLIGYSKQYPPIDEEGFTAALGSLRSPAIAEAAALAEPISPVYCNRSLANRFRRYERIAAPLGGFVAVGDGVCVFNPNYGQGMSTAVISALSLASCVRETLVGFGPGFARAFFRAQARSLEDAWELATGGDFSFPGVMGEPPPGWSLVARYADAVFDAMRMDPVALHDTMEVLHLLKPRTALFALPLLKRVLLRSFHGLVKRGPKREPIPPMPPLAGRYRNE